MGDLLSDPSMQARILPGSLGQPQTGGGASGVGSGLVGRKRSGESFAFTPLTVLPCSRIVLSSRSYLRATEKLSLPPLQDVVK